MTALTLVAALASAGSTAAAQTASGAWTLVRGGERVQVPESRVEGYAAIPLDVLTGLGARIDAVRGSARVRLGAADLTLTAGSPFFLLGGELRQLVDPPYERGGSFFVPVQLLVDHLTSAPGAELSLELASRTVRRGTGASAAAPAAGSPRSAAAPALATAPPSQPVRTPAREAAPAARAPTAAPAAAPASPRSAPSGPAARRLVVIDAGHGGVDPGALGPSGVREKDVALAVANRLFALLREDRTFEVRMTRDRDTLIALTDRTRLANSWRREGQDALFMSIHANAHDRSTVRGFETFFLSEAQTEDARRVADRENAAQRFERPGQAMDPLSFIMHDLRRNRYLRDSSAWAAMVQDRLANVHPGPNRGVKQAGFVVLNGAFMPAVLVELGFITHPEEERMLASADYQARLARQLAAAVRDFFAHDRDTVRAR